MTQIRLGSRGSPLAMAQAHLVRDMLASALGADNSNFPIESFTTTGDKILDKRLQDAGGKGLFTKELDEALDAHRIDAAIHSMKDLPTKLPPGQILCCVPSREDPRDAFICNKADDLMELREGAVVGTASLRRQAQTLHLRPDLKVVTLRGSLQTRLKRLAEGDIDATFLALAGLTRLGLAGNATALVASDAMPSAAGQGALAITCRTDDTATRAAFAKLTLVDFEIATTAERAFLDALDGSCRTPIGALAKVEGNTLSFIGEVLTPDGARRWRRTETVGLGAHPHDSADALGRRLGAEIRAEAGADFQPNEVGAW
ncbi:MAG: hydroxymethylbilane synthase [Proteobacteria bacterium]|nr:hydroxymethylbilane synthase [Pseudomonadota bacterium]